MPRKSRPNTAEVTIKFRVAKGCSASQARQVIWNNLGVDLEKIYLDPDEADAVGIDVLKARVGRARIVRA